MFYWTLRGYLEDDGLDNQLAFYIYYLPSIIDNSVPLTYKREIENLRSSTSFEISRVQVEMFS